MTRRALSIVFRPEHLRKTVKIALVVGVVLTAINQFDVFIRGDVTALTFVKAALNFCVPFVVANVGLLAGKRAEWEKAQADATAGVRPPRESPPEPSRRARTPRGP